MRFAIPTIAIAFLVALVAGQGKVTQIDDGQVQGPAISGGSVSAGTGVNSSPLGASSGAAKVSGSTEGRSSSASTSKSTSYGSGPRSRPNEAEEAEEAIAAAPGPAIPSSIPPKIADGQIQVPEPSSGAGPGAGAPRPGAPRPGAPGAGAPGAGDPGAGAPRPGAPRPGAPRPSAPGAGAPKSTCACPPEATTSPVPFEGSAPAKRYAVGGAMTACAIAIAFAMV
ncbi:hypothetical protein L873DRAFT_1843534 [Choiromyces venosus 120613-1]|uniref:Uncharacterized protein n=1 Tax=Choiromyces venosus 120613-1 TaxID=1336337 RepID=A0A3N4JS18_9PEZI|nr:hypothetical protein L873DRAFT_1843534 [Choiromyces venosus 120613-1]